MTIDASLKTAIQKFEAGRVGPARLDAQLLLGYVLDRPREWLIAHGDTELTSEQLQRFETLVERRLAHEPVVHLTGTREFYGLNFVITPDVLTPRAETEQMVEWAIKYAAKDSRLIDIGTGSGAIATAIAINRPDLAITTTEITDEALEVAGRNFASHGVDAKLVKSDLWNNVEQPFETIVTNLPYLRDDADLMPEVRREPAVALFGGPDGLDLYRRFLAGVPRHLMPSGYLFTECDPWQHDELIKEAKEYGLVVIEQGYFILGFQYQPA